MGRYAIVLKENKEVIGWCGLNKTEKQETDIGFRLLKKYWGSGYATEAVGAFLEFGFTGMGLTMILGRTLKANTASVRVLEKAGMKNPVAAILHDAPALIFSITRDEWEKK